MGTVAREIVGEARQEIIVDLNRGVAAELNDAYRYLLLSKLAAGLHAPAVASFFADTARDEWRHMGEMIERIIQLGGRPMAGPHEAAELSYASYEPPPGADTDLSRMLEDSLKGERAAIRFYAALFGATKDVDPVTAEMARAQLADEIADEDELEGLLAEGSG